MLRLKKMPLNTMKDIMKRNYKVLLLALMLAFASCSFTTKTFEDPDKDRLLIETIIYVLEEAHYSPKELNDEFSARVFDAYLDQLDPFKRYFYASDIKEFEAYRGKIDDQLKARDLSFFNLTHQRLLQRIEESQVIYKDVLAKPFDYSIDEEINTEYKKLPYVNSKKEMLERWRIQLKFSTIANYDDLISQQENTFSAKKKVEDMTHIDVDGLGNEVPPARVADIPKETKEKKPLSELEAESRTSTLNSLNELYAYINERNREDWFAVYMNAIVADFDPHTFYYAPEDKERFDVAMSGKFEGIGARLQKKMDVVTIVEIISGGPAWKQNKLEAGDQILKVQQEDGEPAVSIVGMRLDDAVKLIKGPKGTKVVLTIKKVDGTIEDLSIARDVVELEETYAKSSTVIKNDRKFGVINLPGFYVNMNDYNKRNAATDVKLEIERLKKEGIEGLVLDLRNNGGGSLQTVIDMAGLFIKEGPIVQVKTTGGQKEVLRDKDKSVTWDGPLVVLVNENSASASEILAAAMQDYKRALVIGSEQTFGKGTVQTLFDLNRLVKNNTLGDLGALKYTIQKYYRIDGGSTQLEGVKSDIVVPDRYSYIALGEKNQDNPLAYDKIDAANYTVWENDTGFKKAVENSYARIAKNDQLKLIDQNAKWVKKLRDKELYSLKYNTYKANLKQNEEEAKEFDKLADYKTNLTFKSLPYEVDLMEADSVLKEKRDRWHKALSRDVYVEEAINVLNDLKGNNDIKKLVKSLD